MWGCGAVGKQRVLQALSVPFHTGACLPGDLLYFVLQMEQLVLVPSCPLLTGVVASSWDTCVF